MPKDVTANPTDDSANPTESFIGEDGTFTGGWRDKYVPEDIRGDAVFDRVSTIQGVFKSLASAEKMIGKNKIAIPNENSGDDEWSAWHKAHGMPDKPDDYKFNLPDGVQADTDQQKKYSEVFHSLGLNQKQVDGLVALELARQTSAYETKLAEEKAESQALKETLLSEWGNAYEQKKHLGNVAIEQGVKGESEEFKDRIVEKFGNDPDLIKLLSNLGAKFAEHGAVPSSLVVADTPAQIDEKINELMASDACMNRNHANHKSVMLKIEQLSKELSKAG